MGFSCMLLKQVIMSPLNSTDELNLDKIVDKIIVPVRCQYPRYSFIKGITNLTLLTANERAGVAFVLA